MSQVPNGFPRFKTGLPKGRLAGRGDRRCRCGSGRLQYPLYNDMGDWADDGCTLCGPGKQLAIEAVRVPIKQL